MGGVTTSMTKATNPNEARLNEIVNLGSVHAMVVESCEQDVAELGFEGDEASALALESVLYELDARGLAS